jgi:hypothetical protein
MPGSDIKNTLARLHAELEDAPTVDEDLKQLLLSVDEDIHQLLEQKHRHADDVTGITERLEGMATDFAVQHPTTERFFREIIEALGRMGI